MLSWMVLGSGFVQSAHKGAAKWLKMSGALGCVGLALGFSTLGVGRALAAPLASAIDKHSDQPAQAMPPSLRQALITARQNEAGKEFAWQPGAGKKPAQIRHPQGFRVAAQADQLQFGAPGQAVGMHLAALQCAGEKRQVLDVNRPGPTVTNRRAEYSLQGGVTEWYENGPMGLEQGFTLSKPCNNPGALTLEIALTGTKSIQQTGTEAEPSLQITPRDPAQKPYNYSNLYAQDAQGKALKAKMSTRGEKILLTVETAEAKYPIVVDPLVWAQAQKVTADDGKQYDYLGYSVALSGDTAVIGAYLADLAASGSDYGTARTDAGAAYVFVRSGAAWTQQAKLVATDGKKDDEFGRSVAIDGNTVVIGAHYADLAASGFDYGTARTDAGAAYVFVRSGTIWTQQAKLVAGTDGKRDDEFGRSVALSGDTVLIGAPLSLASLVRTGAAYVFVRSGGAWTPQDKLIAADGKESDSFGTSLALWDNTAVIGAKYAGLAAAPSSTTGTDRPNAGAAYVFVRNGAAWTPQAKLVAADGQESDYFGDSLALGKDTVLIGASGANLATHPSSSVGNARPNAGAAYVFVRSRTGWSEQAKLTAADGQRNDYFGTSLALWGDTAVVGADSAGLAEAPKSSAGDVRTRAGAAYVFVRNDAGWSQKSKLVAADGLSDDQFGSSVALADGIALIGAPSSAGSGYFFHLGGAGGDSCEQGSDCASFNCDPLFKKCGWAGASACRLNSECRSNLCNSGVCTQAAGDHCGASAECANGLCVDGVCCDSACGGGVEYDCMACSVAKGGAQNGVCGPVLKEAGLICRAAAAGQLCDAGAFCDGMGWTCPSENRVKAAGSECRASQGEGDAPELCDGTLSSCPADSGRPPAPPKASGCRCEAMAGNNFSLSAWLLPAIFLGLTLLRRPRRA